MDPFPRGAQLQLAQDEVQVWRSEIVALARYEPHCMSMLSPDEQERASGFRFPEPRLRFVATRGLLRSLLGSYLCKGPRAIRFRYSDRGKPALDGQTCQLHFNVSHSENVVLLAFSLGREVGVDVEYMRRNVEIEDLARRFLSESERAGLAELAPEQRRQAFFHCWTRKEAFIKAVGQGLALPLHQFDVSLDQSARLLATRPDPTEKDRWSLWAIEAGPEYAAALAARGTDLRPVTRDINSVLETVL